MRGARWAVLGLIAGAVVGFVYGGRVRDAAPSAVKVRTDGGRVIVSADVGQALASGLPQLLR